MNNKYAFLVAFAVLFTACGNPKTPSDTGQQHKQVEKSAQKKEMTTVNTEDLEDGLYAQFKVTQGEILVKLYMDRAPLTVANFVALAEGQMENSFKPVGTPFYDGLTFHRVISKSMGQDDFMIQGGDPMGTGQGGPGYSFRDEFHPELRHNKPGILSMANSGPNSNGSQFFITIIETPHLDDRHSVFGEVVSGQDVVNKTLQNDRIFSLTILRAGEAAKNFDAPATFEKLR